MVEIQFTIVILGALNFPLGDGTYSCMDGIQDSKDELHDESMFVVFVLL